MCARVCLCVRVYRRRFSLVELVSPRVRGTLRSFPLVCYYHRRDLKRVCRILPPRADKNFHANYRRLRPLLAVAPYSRSASPAEAKASPSTHTLV